MAHRKGFYERFIKRPQDFILSLVALIVMSPVFLVLAILVRAKLGSPVIFKQERPGLNGRIFTLYKFRSMSDARDENGNLLPDEVRLTRFGKILRSTSLDELPELVKVCDRFVILADGGVSEILDTADGPVTEAEIMMRINSAVEKAN